MEKCNYKAADAARVQPNYFASDADPKEKVLNEQDQDITVNAEAESDEADKGFQAFEEGLKNDNISTEEGKKGSKS